MSIAVSHETAASPESSAPDFGWSLATLLRVYLRRVGEALEGLPGGPRAFQVMDLAARGICQSQAAMAEQLGLDRTVMTYVVDGLEAEKLVVRSADPADRRARRVRLTPKGIRVHAEMAERVAHVESRILGHLGGDDAGRLRELLGTVAQLADSAARSDTACEVAESISS